MRQLIIHADDFGLSQGVNRGLLEAHREGVVTSASILTNFSASSQAIEWANQSNLDVGLHFNLTQGHPLSAPDRIPSLLDARGQFLPLHQLIQKCLLRKIELSEVREELAMQYRYLTERGIEPSHLDGHQHIHILPGIRGIVRDFLRERSVAFVREPKEMGGVGVPRLAARMFLRVLQNHRGSFFREAGVQSLPFYGLSLSPRAGRLESWRKLLSRIREGIAEIMVHPGLNSGISEKSERRSHQKREREYRILTGAELKNMIRESGFQLISFRDLSVI